ncbi:MAG: M6 family metalloprotease domain-containing protein [Bacteroidaceae bacterium]|nr:M6 family metalloprotease domain-containing protein [Bacteroidaceae bacterium]
MIHFIASLQQKLLVTLILMVLPICCMAQEWSGIERGGCMPDLTEADIARRAQLLKHNHRIPPIKDLSGKTEYRQLVILVEFTDCQFTCDAPWDYYNRMFNESGFTESQEVTIGSLTDYLMDQSNGLFHVTFDVAGPYRVSSKAKPNPNANSGTRYYGKDAFKEATEMFVAEFPDLDYSLYDWDGDGKVNQVLYIYAGLAGNQGILTQRKKDPETGEYITDENGEVVRDTLANSWGHIWPNTSMISVVKTPNNGPTISNFSCSGELWMTGTIPSMGIGTICHEYMHSLGLPDIYPTDGNYSPYSVLDAWDVMDGGNFTNYGWCPPNLTALEKMLMGWVTPTELKEPVSIIGMKPSEIYQIKHTDTEYFLLENRQWTGWDAGLPGRGLAVYYVDYNAQRWSGNTVNNLYSKEDHLHFTMMLADQRNYASWKSELSSYPIDERYKGPHRMNCRYLSDAAYPFVNETTENRELTDTSTPAATVYSANEVGQTILNKAITNIQMADDGTISFDFMGGTTDIKEVNHVNDDNWYDLQGRKIESPTQGLYIKNGKLIFKK